MKFLHDFKVLHPYVAPHWLPRHCQLPTHRLNIANIPTPIQRWHLKNIPIKFNVYIKRDDLTGCYWSGNKIRKLEFLLADTLFKKCANVITCGGVQSNHARATVAVCAELKLKSHLILRSKDKAIDRSGNQFINQLLGAEIYLVPENAREKLDLFPRMQLLADKIKSEKGEESYVIGVGGSDCVGVFGYIECFRELMDTGALDQLTDIAITCGSGGSLEGLAIANYCTGSKVKVHGLTVSDNSEYFYQHINDTLQSLGMAGVQAQDIVNIIDGYKGEGYGKAYPELLQFISTEGRTNGFMFDPTYTGKGAYGLQRELQENPQQFAGNDVLFIHTGGLFGAMAVNTIGYYNNPSIHWWGKVSELPWSKPDYIV